MRVYIPVAWRKHKTGSKLKRILPQPVLLVSSRTSALASGSIVAPKYMQYVGGFEVRGLVRDSLFIYQERKSDTRLVPEKIGVGEIAKADRC